MKPVEMQFGLKGFFKFEKFKIDENGNEIKGTRKIVADWFPNLITNNGLDLVGQGGANGLNTVCHVGSGSTTPSFTDTALVSQIATSSTLNGFSVSVQSSSSPYYVDKSRTFRFNTGVATGNISEVGVSPSGGTLFSRALILDQFGNPTTITVLSDEALDITYKLRIFCPMTDVTGTKTLGTEGGSYNYTVRAIDFFSNDSSWTNNNSSLFNSFRLLAGLAVYTTENNTLEAITANRSGVTGSTSSSNTTSSLAFSAYTNGNYYRDVSYVLDLSFGNFGTGLGKVMLPFSNCSFQFAFSPKIPKISTKKFTIVIRVSWVRV